MYFVVYKCVIIHVKKRGSFLEGSNYELTNEQLIQWLVEQKNL